MVHSFPTRRSSDLPGVTADMRTRLEGLMREEALSEPAEETSYTPEEQELLESRLRDLGYLD